MDLFDVIVSPGALHQLESYIDYIQNTLLNNAAAYSVWQDALDTRRRLSESAGSHMLCRDARLASLGYRFIRFSKHRYIMLYRVDGRTAYVHAIYHELQDYEHVLFTEQVE